MMQPDWLDKDEYPFPSNFFHINAVRQHYIDVGSGETILFVHGTPSWSFDFRMLIQVLSANNRCVAVDHIGFGLSDKPKDYDYSTWQHAQTLKQFIEQKQLKDITLVLHDFGGPIGLEYALNHSQNIKRLVIINSWIGSSINDPEFIKLSRILRSPILPFLYLYLNFSPRFLLPGSFGNNRLSGRLLNQYTRPFKSRNERYGTLAFARSLLNDQEWFEQQWKRRGQLASKPMLLIWGMKDRVVTPRHLDKFKSAFPHASELQLETCGHFPQEEEPEQVSLAISRLLKS
jgi:pimeloyl-ACP methyl ester carboxylesterase